MADQNVNKEPNKTSHNMSMVWSDDETLLLLNVTNEYKNAMAAEGIDYDTVKSKYKEIFNRFIAQIPEKSDKFPHLKEEFTLAVVKSKLKNVRAKYQKSVQAKRKSGFGRVVLLYFDECERIWGGSSSTTSIDNGIETSALSVVENDQLDVSSQSVDTSSSSDDFNGRRALLSKKHLLVFSQRFLHRSCEAQSKHK